MHNLDTSAQAERLMAAAATLAANGIVVYRPFGYADRFSICTAGRTKDGFTGPEILAMAEALIGPVTTEEVKR